MSKEKDAKMAIEYFNNAPQWEKDYIIKIDTALNQFRQRQKNMSPAQRKKANAKLRSVMKSIKGEIKKMNESRHQGC